MQIKLNYYQVLSIIITLEACETKTYSQFKYYYNHSTIHTSIQHQSC